MTAFDTAFFGKRFVVEPVSTSLTSEEKDILSELQPAGVMFRRRNFVNDVPYDIWLGQFRELLAEIRSVITHPRFIISIDHEGGRVIRPPEPITRFPYPAFWGEHMADVAHAMAVELRSLGINVSFSPVADIHSNPENPVINERAFGTTVEQVIAQIVPFTEILWSHGILPCAKHFPGHGDTQKDSHYDLPVLDLTVEQLLERELKPFQALIDIQVPLIMTAHIMFPKLDPDAQATISSVILNEVLRRRLYYKGVVISDGLCMKAISERFSTGDGVVRALNAPLDLLLIAGDDHGCEWAKELVERMKAAHARGDLNEQLLHDSAERIDILLSQLQMHDVTQLDMQLFETHKALADRILVENQKFAFHVPGFE